MSDKGVQYEISLKDLLTGPMAKMKASTDGLDASVRRVQSNLNGLQNTIKGLAAGFSLAVIGREIFEAGTNMENLNISLKTMLGSKSEADKLIAEMVQFAKTTPFSQMEVQTAGKQLLAYGFAAKDIIPTLRRIGDVSAGISQPVGEIAYLYGTIKTQGKAMTVDLRQFANRGIPIYEELAKITGKTGAALQKYIEDGQIGFPQIQKAFENMTGAGGKFNNLTEQLAKTTGGMWSNVKDQVSLLAVEAFGLMQSTINKVFQVAQKLLNVLSGLMKWMKENKEMLKALAFGATVAAAAFGVYTLATWSLNTALLALLANPVVLFLAGIALIGAALYLAYQRSEGFRNAINILGDAILYVFGYDISESPLAKSLNDNGPLANSLRALRAIWLGFAYSVIFVREMLKHPLEMPSDIKIRADALYDRGFGEAKRARERMDKIAGKNSGEEGSGGIFKDMENKVKEAANIGSDVSAASGTKTTTVNINIGNLIEKFNITTNNMSESASKIKQMVTEAMIEAVNDSQIAVGQ